MIDAFLHHSSFPSILLEMHAHSNIPCIYNINPAYEKLTGYTLAELKGEVPPIFNDLQVIEKIHKYGSFEGESLCHRKDHTTFWARFSFFPIKDENDSILYYAIIFINANEQKELDHKYKILDGQFYNLVQNVPSVIYRCALDEFWTMEFMSDHIYELSGFHRDDFIKNNIRSFASIIHPEDVMAVEQTVLDSIYKKLPYTIEYRIIHSNGSIRYVYEKGQATFTGYDDVAHLDGVITDITERIVYENEIKKLAFYDPLTGLPNRRLFMDRLHQIQLSGERNGNLSALLFLDLDTFKELNDTFGHDHGDLLLKQVAERLETCLRKDDTIGRIGGDEFVIVLNEVEYEEHEDHIAIENVMKVIEKIMITLNVPYMLNNIEYKNSSSIGITLFHGLRYSVEELLKQADLALYDAKKSGRNTYRFFSR